MLLKLIMYKGITLRMFSFEEYIVDVFSSYQREYHISLHLLLLALSNLNLVLEEKESWNP
jgi:hypothetical protein